jgi:hypothetical protein
MDKPKLTYKLGEREIRWTYGLQLDIQRIVPDAESLMATIMSEPSVRDYLVRRCLTDKKGSVENADELVKIEDVELDPEEVLGLLNWISSQLLHFFMNSAKNLAEQTAAFKAALPSMPSTAGSAA